ncbi:hypothetical protein STEG23_036941, partial [Scotinomys teguina]
SESCKYKIKQDSQKLDVYVHQQKSANTFHSKMYKYKYGIAQEIYTVDSSLKIWNTQLMGVDLPFLKPSPPGSQEDSHPTMQLSPTALGPSTKNDSQVTTQVELTALSSLAVPCMIPMGVFCLHVCMNTKCVPDACGSQKKVLRVTDGCEPSHGVLAITSGSSRRATSALSPEPPLQLHDLMS